MLNVVLWKILARLNNKPRRGGGLGFEGAKGYTFRRIGPSLIIGYPDLSSLRGIASSVLGDLPSQLLGPQAGKLD